MILPSTVMFDATGEVQSWHPGLPLAGIAVVGLDWRHG